MQDYSDILMFQNNFNFYEEPNQEDDFNHNPLLEDFDAREKKIDPITMNIDP